MLCNMYFRVAKIACIAFGAAIFPTLGNATQIFPSVEYSNDSQEQNGVLQACIITAALTSPRPPESPSTPEIINLQFIMFGVDSPAYKVAAGYVDRSKRSSAGSITAANFSTAEFNHPDAFKQSVTPEGELLAVLIDPELQDEFITAFLQGHYFIEVRS